MSDKPVTALAESTVSEEELYRIENLAANITCPLPVPNNEKNG